jgi:molybdopterin molybdotransferase
MTGPAGGASGRSALLPVSEALSIILDIAGRRGREIETIPVAEADGRVLAMDLSARRTQPPFDVSSMDGFALQAADTDPPGKMLRLIGESAAGHPFSGRLNPGEAVRISTGASLPEGADAVLLQERAELAGDHVTSQIRLVPGTFIRKAGRDFAVDATLLHAGTRLTPGTIALAGAMDHAQMPVFRRPRLAILATGDELVPPGTPDRPDAIVATNGYAIAALCRAAGAEVRELGIARDTLESTNAAFDAAQDWPADCLVTIGGASVGIHDLVSEVAHRRGAKVFFRKVAMRPGKPFNFSTLGPDLSMLVAGLPGNPISSLVCAKLFLVPLIGALQGDAAAGQPERELVRLGADVSANDERQDHLRACLIRDGDGVLTATPLPDQDSSLLSVYARADALVVRPPHAPAARTGDFCQILRI